MKNILRTFILLFFLNSCAYEYTPPKPDFKGTSAEYDYEIFLSYSEIGCESVLKIKNNSSQSQSAYIELTAFDGNDTNVDMTNYMISLGSNEVAERSSTFIRVDYCSEIKKIRISIKDY
jgi:hypothetical protein